MCPERVTDQKSGDEFLEYKPQDRDRTDYLEGLERARTYNKDEKSKTVNWVAYYNVFQRLPADLNAYRLRHPLKSALLPSESKKMVVNKVKKERPHAHPVVNMPFDGLYEEKMVKFPVPDPKLAKKIIANAVKVMDIMSEEEMGNLLWKKGGPMFGAQTSSKDRGRIVNLTRAYLQSKRWPQEEQQERVERKAEAKVFSGAKWIFQSDRMEQIKLAAIFAANFLWPETKEKFGMEVRRATAEPVLTKGPERFLLGYDERLWKLDPALIERNIRGYEDRARVQRLATLLFKTIEGEKPARAEFDDLIIKAIGHANVNSREFQIHFSNARAFLVVALLKGEAPEEMIKKARFLEKDQVGL